ncbi:hypothetical protein [Actinoplanes sp. N902-109]|uniref:hypothetical protein n=1 Tax=Actinoplanes sp. (strain N902-109) TaxID=649831 RepID=UPI0003AA7446|nr:hypothetical protein [Actinoplanes sp. N902-109]
MWHGSSPLQQTIIDAGAQRGIAVTVEQRAFDRETLETAARQVSGAAPANLNGFQVGSVLPITADFDGLIVQGTPAVANGPVSTRITVRVKIKPDVGDPATKVAAADPVMVSVPAERVALDGPASTPEPLSATRDNDISPHKAGGLMRDASTSPATVCSTGFAIRRNGVNYTTTARHGWHHAYKAYSNSSHNYGDGCASQSWSKWSAMPSAWHWPSSSRWPFPSPATGRCCSCWPMAPS